MSRELTYLKQAIQLANDNMYQGGGPFGAVIVYQGKVIGQGGNRVTVNCDPTAHAEVQAIRDACQHLGNWSLQGCELYTSCEPCPMCLAAAYWARIDTIWYAASREDAAAAGFDDAHFYRELSIPIDQRCMAMHRGAELDGKQVLEKWQTLANKQPY